MAFRYFMIVILANQVMGVTYFRLERLWWLFFLTWGIALWATKRLAEYIETED